jgi:hypothetical protein
MNREIAPSRTWMRIVVAALIAIVMLYATVMFAWMNSVDSRLQSLSERMDEAEITNLLQRFP